jgi:hypothetical protein
LGAAKVGDGGGGSRGAAWAIPFQWPAGDRLCGESPCQSRAISDKLEDENNDAAWRNERLPLMISYGDNMTKRVIWMQEQLTANMRNLVRKRY